MAWIALVGWIVVVAPGDVQAGPALRMPAQGADRPRQCELLDETPSNQLWDCQPGFATGHDQVSISTSLPTTPIALGDIQRLNPSLTDVIVSFDVGADGLPNLVLYQYLTEEGHAVAEYYDDQNGNGYVDYRITGQGQLASLEAGPVIRILARDGWFHAPDGKINFNLDITIDGPIRATFDFRPQDIDVPDGRADVEIFVRDVDEDGSPDYEWRQHWLPLPLSDGYQRTEIVVNTEDDERPIVDWFVVPFLSTKAEQQGQYYVKRGYEVSPPPINVNWSTSQVSHFAEVVTSRHNPGNYFVYSLERAERSSSPTRANFENPLAFYDLSGNRELIPNLLIRNAHFPVDDRYAAGSPGRRFATNDVTYTWRLPAESPVALPVWDYKISLVGRHDYEHVESFPDFDIYTADYARLPEWVLSRPWDLAAFVAAEGAQFANDEGIAEWGAILERHAPESYEYVAGARDRLALDNYRFISPGYRGEIAVDFGREPLVYLSTVDGKLHLLHAGEGIWRVSETEAIRYWDLDGDGYFDGWSMEQWQGDRSHPDDPPQRTAESERLQVLPHFILWQRGGQLRLRRAETKPAVFVGSPPSDTTSYHALGAQIEAHGNRAINPADLHSWLDPFPGPTQTIDRATIAAVRATAERGYRFELHLAPGFTASGEPLLPLADLDPGAYLVTLADDRLAVAPLTPPQPAVSLRPADPQPTTFAPQSLRVEVTNAGLADAPGLTLHVQTIDPAGTLTTLARQPADALAGQPTTTAVTWQPAQAGPWLVSAQLLDDGGRVMATAPITIPVAAGLERALPAQTVGGAGGRFGLFGALLASLAACLVAAFSLARRGAVAP